MSRRVPSKLVIGGNQPFVRRLIGVSTSPMMGSICNMGVWDKFAAAWVNVATRRTLAREEAARRRYQQIGRSLENGGCIGDPHIVVDRCMVFLCILHCCMAIGRLQVAFIETRLVDLPKENTDAVQWALYRACTGVKLSLNAILKRTYNDHSGRGGGDAGGNPSRAGGGGSFTSVGVVVFKI